jgi:membrane associated rhomboid family serine protease
MATIYNISKKKSSFFRGLSVNLILILLNVILFFVFTILMSFDLFSIDFIAIQPANILTGQYLWTFLTSMFMHAGFFHLFANMISLLFIGSLVEKILGKKRYFWFYIISGLFAGLFFVITSQIFSVDLNTFAVGASGAIFGLIGLLMLLTPNLPVYLMFIPIPIKMKYAAPGILILLWLISAMADMPVGNTAHLGGLISGLIYAIYLKNKYKNKTKIIKNYFS